MFEMYKFPLSHGVQVLSFSHYKCTRWTGGCSSTKISKYVAEEDIISNLPDGLKDKILCCLPIKEAVGTCLLSRNWRYTWTSMTELMFRGDDFASDNGYDECRFLKFTDMFLSLHNGPVLKFGLDTQGIEISTGCSCFQETELRKFNL
jgi:hypothetical protein